MPRKNIVDASTLLSPSTRRSIGRSAARPTTDADLITSSSRRRIGMSFTSELADEEAAQERVVEDMCDAAALGTYVTAFDDVKGDLFRIMKGMKPERQTEFYTTVLKPLVAKTRRDVAQAAKKFKGKKDKKSKKNKRK